MFSNRGIKIITLFLSFALFLSIGLLFYVQTYLISNNMTSVESVKPLENIEIENSALNNMKIVLGKSYYEWLFPLPLPKLYNLSTINKT